MVDFDQVELKLEEETGIQEADLSGNQLLLFPNPNRGEILNLRNPDHLSGKLSIHDMLGRCIWSRKLHGEPEIQITFPEPLEPGLYILHMGAAGDQCSTRFLVH